MSIPTDPDAMLPYDGASRNKGPLRRVAWIKQAENFQAKEWPKNYEIRFNRERLDFLRSSLRRLDDHHIFLFTDSDTFDCGDI